MDSIGKVRAASHPSTLPRSGQEVVRDGKVKNFQELNEPRMAEVRRQGGTVREKPIDAGGTLLFEVLFRGEAQDLGANDRSVIVEVELENIVHMPILEQLGKGAQEFAEELAPEVAMQVVQKDFPHGFEPSFSVLQIDKLPFYLKDCPPNFQGSQFRAWLVCP
jgi:hypothetical protein